MENFGEFLNEPVGVFVALVTLALWFIYLPRIVAPLLVHRWQNIPERYRSVIIVMLPTIENALADIWKRIAFELEAKVQVTEIELDDILLDAIDERITKIIANISNPSD